MRFLAFAPCVLVLLGGCAQLAQIPDDQFAHDIYVGTHQVVAAGLKLAIRKSTPDDVKKIVADLVIADTILQKNIIPAFSGASTADVIRSAVDTALNLLKDKIKNPQVVDGIDAGIELLLINIHLPTSPTAAIDQRTLKALNGLFTGIDAGIQSALAIATAPPSPVRATLELPK